MSGNWHDQVQAITGNADKWEWPLSDAATRWQIDTAQRVAFWLAQCAHESGGFRYTREIWGPTPAQERYEGRRDLGNTELGDGHRFLGRGLIQITGRANYKACGDALGMNLILFPDVLEVPSLAASSAGWFWAEHGCNELADAGDFEAVTRRINGGTTGMADRLAWLERTKAALA